MEVIDRVLNYLNYENWWIGLEGRTWGAGGGRDAWENGLKFMGLLA